MSVLVGIRGYGRIGRNFDASSSLGARAPASPSAPSTTPRPRRRPSPSCSSTTRSAAGYALASADIVGNAAPCVFSAADTMSGGKMVKVLGWHDNVWGYASRLADLVDLLVTSAEGGAR